MEVLWNSYGIPMEQQAIPAPAGQRRLSPRIGARTRMRQTAAIYLQIIVIKHPLIGFVLIEDRYGYDGHIRRGPFPGAAQAN